MHLSLPSALSLLLTTTLALASPFTQTPFTAPMSNSPTVLLPHARDHATYSNYEQVQTKHLHLDWTIDWTKQVVGGSVRLEMEVVGDKGVGEVVLDVRNVEVSKVEMEGVELKVSTCLDCSLVEKEDAVLEGQEEATRGNRQGDRRRKERLSSPRSFVRVGYEPLPTDRLAISSSKSI